MSASAIFLNNRSQAVRLPADMRFADEVKKVQVRKLGNERILSPVEQSWDSFFLATPAASEDFARPQALSSKRESLD